MQEIPTQAASRLFSLTPLKEETGLSSSAGSPRHFLGWWKLLSSLCSTFLGPSSPSVCVCVQVQFPTSYEDTSQVGFRSSLMTSFPRGRLSKKLTARAD